jgi:transposase InsO family protein
VWRAIRNRGADIGNRQFGSQERIWVRFRIPPPIKLAKTLFLHVDQPRHAPSLAGFFTWACGLGRPPRRLILAFLARFPSLFLYSLRTLWRIIKYERVYLRAYDGVSAVRADLAQFICWYNTVRPHSSLDDQTPDQAYWATLPAVKMAA